MGLVDRIDLIFFKLYASCDATGPMSVHYQDMRALSPTDDELDSAAQWVRLQDASPEFHAIVDKVVLHARADR